MRNLAEDRKVFDIEMKKVLFWFIVISLSITYFHLIRPHMPESDDNIHAALQFSRIHPSEYNQPFWSTWESRIFPCLVIGKVVDAFVPYILSSQDTSAVRLHVHVVLAAYYTFWLFATFVLFYIFNRVEEAIVLVLGTFSSCLYLITKTGGMILLPWDLVAMFFFTLAVYLYRTGRFWPFVAAVFVGSCFKETVLCCALLIFFFPTQRKIGPNVFLFALLFALKALSNELLIYLYYPGGHVYKPITRDPYSHVPLLLINIRYFFEAFASSLPHYAICSGLLFFIGLFFWKLSIKLEYLLVLGLFLLGATVLGYWWETRIFTDIAPLLWILVLDCAGLVQPASGQAAGARLSAEGNAAKPGFSVATSPGATRPSVVFWKSRGLVLAVCVALVACCWWLVRMRSPGSSAEAAGTETQKLIEPMAFRAEQGDVEAQFKLALLYQQKGDFTNAVFWYEKAATNSYVANAENNLGVMYLTGQGGAPDYGLAAAHFRRATAQQPDCAEAWAGLGRVLMAQGKMTEALPQFREYARLSPSNAEAQVTFGTALLLAGATNEAASAFSNALTLDPNNVAARQRMGLLQLMRTTAQDPHQGERPAAR